MPTNKELEAKIKERDKLIADLNEQIESMSVDANDKTQLVAMFLAAQLSAKPLPNSDTKNNPHLNEMIKVAEYLAEVVQANE
ncbi:hypothetical protein [Vibrio phage LP.1]|nr:hypothetical protein [Vibrio phage LP.1]